MFEWMHKEGVFVMLLQATGQTTINPGHETLQAYILVKPSMDYDNYSPFSYVIVDTCYFLFLSCFCFLNSIFH